jgi:hypothetical protein
MIADKDQRGNISIMEITPEVSEYLVDALYHYFSEQPIHCRTNAERELILLMRQLEKFQEQKK